MTEALTGRRHNYDSASTRPEVAQKIRDWWTPERKEERRQEILLRSPDARYHGLSARGAKKLKVGRCCARCGSTTRLDIHHKDRNKQNQDLSNLEVLCHRCHMQEHAMTQETGWDSFHRKRKGVSVSRPERG
jgi:5-methylcytosine-specific restriction endonuclease McrA